MKRTAYILIGIGILFLGYNLGWFALIVDKVAKQFSLDLGVYWPFILIFIGIYLLFTIKR